MYYSMYIKYLNFPSVPEHLIEPIEDIVKGPFSFDDGHFKSKNVNYELEKWLKNMFPFDLKVLYQIMNCNLPIHKDLNIASNETYPVTDRYVAINYILDAGGDQVTTEIYDEDRTTILQSEKLVKNCWHYLTVDKFHGVSGIPIGRERVSISISATNQETVLRNLFNYIMVP